MIKEYKQKIWDFYPFRTELHTHTAPASPCSSFSARTLAEALTRQGIHAAVLTNHFGPYHLGLYKSKDEFLAEYLKAYHDLKREADALGLTAIFGIELRFHENKNDYLVLGIDENEISRVYDAVEGGLKHFRASFPEKEILILQAHPDRDGMTHADAALLNGAEVFNLYPGYNPHTAISAKWAKENALAIVVGGSDLHHPGGEGACLLRTKTLPESAEALIAILKSGDYALEIGGSIILP